MRVSAKAVSTAVVIVTTCNGIYTRNTCIHQVIWHMHDSVGSPSVKETVQEADAENYLKKPP